MKGRGESPSELGSSALVPSSVQCNMRRGVAALAALAALTATAAAENKPAVIDAAKLAETGPRKDFHASAGILAQLHAATPARPFRGMEGCHANVRGLTLAGLWAEAETCGLLIDSMVAPGLDAGAAGAGVERIAVGSYLVVPVPAAAEPSHILVERVYPVTVPRAGAASALLQRHGRCVSRAMQRASPQPMLRQLANAPRPRTRSDDLTVGTPLAVADKAGDALEATVVRSL